jgi:hypothetical protein
MSNNSTMPAIEPGVIRTYTGKMFNVFEPDPDLICIEDIAHALSNLCRFGGHTRLFYSVAQHSIRVANEVSPANKMAALLHDASEAYMLDITRPIKYFIPKYREYEMNLMLTIAEVFDFEYPLKNEIILADNLLLDVEWNDLMVSDEYESHYFPLGPRLAKNDFLETYKLFRGPI